MVPSFVQRIPLGLRYMLLAGFFFSLMSVMVKIVGQRLPSSEVVLARSVISLVITFAMLRRVRVRPWGNRKGLLLLRGLVGFVALLCFFYAIPRLPLAEVTVIQFTNPVWVAVLAAFFLSERLGRTEVLCTALSLVGVVLIAKPDVLFGASAADLDVVAVGVALTGAVLAAIAYTTVRKLRETEHPLVVVLYFPLVSVPAAIPIMAPQAVWPTPVEWLLLLGVGLFTQAGQVYLTRGLHAERAGRAMSASYVQVVFAAVWGILFFGEFPDTWSLGGAALILGSTVFLTRSS